MTTTPEQREALRRLLKEATPVPWTYEAGLSGGWGMTAKLNQGKRGVVFARAPWPMRNAESRANGDLVVAAVNALPSLLEEVEAAERALREEREHACPKCHAPIDDGAHSVACLRSRQQVANTEAFDALRAENKTLKAKVAEAEAERDELKNALLYIRDCPGGSELLDEAKALCANYGQETAEERDELREELTASKAQVEAMRGALEAFSPHLDRAEDAMERSNSYNAEEMQAFYDARAKLFASPPGVRVGVTPETKAKVRAALASWVKVMDDMDSDPDDPATAIRQQYHGKRIAQTREALALLDGEKP